MVQLQLWLDPGAQMMMPELSLCPVLVLLSFAFGFSDPHPGPQQCQAHDRRLEKGLSTAPTEVLEQTLLCFL